MKFRESFHYFSVLSILGGLTIFKCMFKHGVLLDVQCSVKGLICSFDKEGLFRTFWGNVVNSSTAHVPDPITGTIVSVINGQTRLIINGPGLFSRHFCLIEHPKLYMHIIWAFHDILSALTSGIYKPTL